MLNLLIYVMSLLQRRNSALANALEATANQAEYGIKETLSRKILNVELSYFGQAC